MLKLELQYFGHLMRRTDSLEKTLAPWKESYDKPREHIKKQRHHLADQSPYSQSYGFSSSHAQMWELDCKGWVLKNWCFQTVALEKILEIPLESKEIKPVNPKGNWRWIFIGRTDAKSEAPNTLGTWCEELTHWKRPWRWERLRAGGEGNDRGWDGWMASPSQMTCLEWFSANHVGMIPFPVLFFQKPDRNSKGL